MNNRIYNIITRNAKGTVLEGAVQNVYEENNLIRAVQIFPSTTFTVTRFDLYTNRAVVDCTYKGARFSALFDLDFLSDNCIVTNIDRNQVIESVYLPEEEIDTRLKFTRYEMGMTVAGVFLIGFLVGAILLGGITCLS